MIGGSTLRIPGILAIVLVAVGIATKSSAMLAIAIPPMVYLAVVLTFSHSARPTPSSLRADRHLSQQRCIEGEEIAVTIEIRSPDRPLAVVSDQAALDGLPLVVDGTTSGAIRLPGPIRSDQDPDSDAAGLLHYTIRADRGEFRLGGTHVTWFTPCPLTPRSVIFSNHSTFRVVPRTSFVPPLRIQPRKTRVYAGSVKTHLGGSGLDFFGCRNYTQGDNTRAINWRIVARTGNLVVNDFEQERIADVNVVLDCRIAPYARSGTHLLFGDSVRAAASLAAQFLDAGNRVGLLMYGDIPDWVYPGVGTLQKMQILDALSRAHLGSREAFRALRNLPTRLIPPGAQLVIVSPLVAFDDAAVLGELRALGYEVLLVSPYVTMSAVGGSEPALADEVAARAMRVLRTSQMTAVQRFGVQVIEWDTSKPLAEAVAQLRHGRRRGTR
ncbi:DUF58 domain-containing protein [Candidatus Bipolaricaulota bacterium]|nr:DUF58 domain-containing protein [Candidatus Bipolaricaulota bacterium]